MVATKQEEFEKLMERRKEIKKKDKKNTVKKY